MTQTQTNRIIEAAASYGAANRDFGLASNQEYTKAFERVSTTWAAFLDLVRAIV